MISEALNCDQKARRGSLSHLILQANKLYGNSNKFAKLRFEEYNNQVSFKYTFPLIFMDFVDSVCGSQILKNLQ